MVVRVARPVFDDNEIAPPAITTTSGVISVSRIAIVSTIQRVQNGVQVVQGNNMVQNAVVSPTSPVFPFEGQVWVKIA